MNEFETIEQLRNFLNEGKNSNALFEIVEINKCKRQLIRGEKEYVTFYVNGKWRIDDSFPTLSDENQRVIIDFLTDEDIKDVWFKEIKYNIVIGADTCKNGHDMAAYTKRSDGTYFVKGDVDYFELANDEYCFSELEIKDLKKQVGLFMAEIVDKGVERVDE